MLAYAKKLYQRFRNRTSDRILRHSLVFFTFTAFVNLLNMVYRKYASIDLSREDFGGFTSLFALFSIISGPFAVLPMYTMKKMPWYLSAGRDAEAFAFFGGMARFVLVTSACAGLALVAASPFLASAYHLPDITPILILLGMLVLANMGGLHLGALQSFQSFGAVGAINVTATAIKLGTTVALFSLLWVSYSTPLVGLAAASAFIWLTAALLLRRERIRRGVPASASRVDLAHLWREGYPILLLLLALSLLRFIDEWFARHYLSGDDSGRYGALVTVGKTSVFLVSTLVTVLFPKLAAASDDPRTTARIMLKGLLLACLGCAAVAAVLFVAPGKVITLLTDRKYADSAPLMLRFFVACTPYALVLLFVNYFIIHRHLGYTFLLLGLVAAEIAAFLLFHGSLADIIWVTGVSGVFFLAISAVFWWLTFRRPTPSSLGESP